MTKTVDCGKDERPEETYARSHGSRDPRKLALLFRCDGSGEQLYKQLLPSVPEGMYLQLAPKGSYRLDNLLDFLSWDLGSADPPDIAQQPGANAEVVLLDWFAPHLDKKVDKLAQARGHVVLRIPGGATPWVAPPDTHAHQPYEREYKNMERWDSFQQLKRGAVLPSVAREVVMARAMAAWRQVPHERNSTNQFIETGITNALDGSDDGRLRHICRPFWYELNMPGVRDQLRAEVQEEVREGRLQSWDQVTELIVDYDDHEPAREGEETARVRMSGPKPDGEMDGRPESRDCPVSLFAGWARATCT